MERLIEEYIKELKQTISDLRNENYEKEKEIKYLEKTILKQQVFNSLISIKTNSYIWKEVKKQFRDTENIMDLESYELNYFKYLIKTYDLKLINECVKEAIVVEDDKEAMEELENE